MLHRVILQRTQVTVTLSAPHTLELPLSGVCALVFDQVLALFEVLIAVVTFVRFLPRVYSPVSVQVRGVLEAFLTFRALERLFP